MKRTCRSRQLREASTGFVKYMHRFMILWGALLLILYTRAAFRSTTTHCAQQAWPWFGTRSTCTLLSMNCIKNAESTGNSTELDSALADLDEQTLTNIVIRHCPSVEILSRIQKFPNLVGIKIYNSKLARWDADAALTRKHHPNLAFLFVVQTNRTQIPLGQQSPDFPSKLNDIEFAWTNLTNLPHDLTQVWPKDGFIMFERCQFASIPQTSVRGSSSEISLVSNNISSLPNEVFTNPIARTLWLDGNPITELPVMLRPSKSIELIDFSNSKLQSLPPWANAAFFQSTELRASGTPLCEQLLSITTSDSVGANLHVAWSAYQIGRVSCAHTMSDYYPYEAEAEQDTN